MKLHNTLLFFICILYFSCNSIVEDNSSSQQLNEIYSLSDGENQFAKQEYFQMRIQNPQTNLIPENIAFKEFEFIKNMPIKKSLNDFQWQHKGPYNVGGRTRAIAIDSNNPNRILLGGVSGGLWESTDRCQNFTKITPNLALHSITSIFQDPRSGMSNNWYFTTGELSGNSADLFGNGIYHSNDNGLTWSVLPSTINDSANIVSNLGDFKWTSDIQVNPTNGDLIVASFAGIFLSQDQGDSWSNVLRADASPNGFGYINYGNQTSVVVNSAGVYIANLSSDAQDAGIWRSTDGLNWTDITPIGFPANFRRMEVAFNPQNDNECLIIVDASTNPSVDNHELWHYTYLTGDGAGVNGNWENRTDHLPDEDCLGFYDFNFGYYQSQNSYDMCIAFHPTIPNLVFLGGTNLYRSFDAFTSDNYSWIGGYQCDIAQPSNYVWPNHHPDNHQVLFFNDDSLQLLSAHDGGVSLTQNCTTPSIVWENVNNGYNTSQFYTVAIQETNVESEFIIGGLQDNGTWHTTSADPNIPWLSTFYGDGAYCAIADDRSAYYVSWQGGKTFKFEINDDGQILGLTRIDPIGGSDYLFINPFILDPNESNTMYLSVGTKIWRNDSLSSIPILNDEYNAISQGWEPLDESSTNTPLSTTNYITALEMSKNNSNVIYYGTYNGLIYKLSGLLTGTFEKTILKKSNMPSGAYVSCIETNPFNENEIIVTYSNYEVKSIFHTLDGGDNWTNISGSLEENPDGSGAGPSINWSHIYIDEIDTIYFIGSTSGLFAATTLQAENTIWERQAVNEIGNVPVTMITSRSFDKNIVVATHGAGVFSTKVVETPIQEVNFNNLNYAVSYPYPNPSNEKVNIDVYSKEPLEIKVELYDLLGKKVKILSENEKIEKGNNQLKWRIDKLKEGFYWMLININDESISRKIQIKY